MFNLIRFQYVVELSESGDFVHFLYAILIINTPILGIVKRGKIDSILSWVI